MLICHGGGMRCRIRDMSSPLSPDLHRRATVLNMKPQAMPTTLYPYINVGYLYLSGLIQTSQDLNEMQYMHTYEQVNIVSKKKKKKKFPYVHVPSKLQFLQNITGNIKTDCFDILYSISYCMNSVLCILRYCIALVTLYMK